MYCTDHNNLRISFYVKDNDNKEYRIAYINFKNIFSKIDFMYLDKVEKKDGNYRVSSLLIEFVNDLNKKIYANDQEIINFLKKKGYVKTNIDQVITYGYASDHDRGSTSNYLECILGFVIDKEFGYKEPDISSLSKKYEISSSDLKSIYDLYSKFEMLEIFVKKIEDVANQKCYFEFAFNNEIEDKFDPAILDYKIKKENEILPYNVPKEITHVYLKDTFDGRQNRDLFVVLNKMSKEEFSVDLTTFIDKWFNKRLEIYRNGYDDKNFLFSPCEDYFDMIFNDYHNDEVILVYKDGNKKYPYCRLKKNIDRFDQLEIEYSRKKYVYDITYNLFDEKLTFKELLTKLTKMDEDFLYQLHTNEKDLHESLICHSSYKGDTVYNDRNVLFVSKTGKHEYFIVIEGKKEKDFWK